MEPAKENLSAQQSLEIITAMIRQAKGNLSSNSFYFILWGWTIAIANLGVFVLIRFTDFERPTIMFSLTIVSAIISAIYGSRQNKNATSRSIIDTANIAIWVCFGVICFTIVAFGSKTNWQINAIIILVASIPTFVTGVMLRFRPLMFGGIALYLFGIIIFLLPKDLQFLASSIAVTVGYLIPGYMLRKLKD
jgi:hypothetical protein